MNYRKEHILLVEDDATLGYLLKEYLGMNGFNITLAKTAAEGLKALDINQFDLAILDVMLPDRDGFDLAKSIQNQHPSLPFLFLTARSLKVDVLKGFSLGAVDYLKKPIDEEELVVRIKALLTRLDQSRNPQDTDQKNIQLGHFTFNALNQELRSETNTVKLTKRESELLSYLVQHRNNLCSHKDILIHLWGKSDYFNKKSLNVFISHLRKYLQEDPRISIENVHKQGFILRVKE